MKESEEVEGETRTREEQRKWKYKYKDEGNRLKNRIEIPICIKCNVIVFEAERHK